MTGKFDRRKLIGNDIFIVDFQDSHGGPYVKGVYVFMEDAYKGVEEAFKEDKRNHGGSGKYRQTHRTFPQDLANFRYFEAIGYYATATIRRYTIK